MDEVSEGLTTKADKIRTLFRAPGKPA